LAGVRPPTPDAGSNPKHGSPTSETVSSTSSCFTLSRAIFGCDERKLPRRLPTRVREFKDLKLRSPGAVVAQLADALPGVLPDRPETFGRTSPPMFSGEPIRDRSSLDRDRSLRRDRGAIRPGVSAHPKPVNLDSGHRSFFVISFHPNRGGLWTLCESRVFCEICKPLWARSVRPQGWQRPQPAAS
jgi:hypothetical protein